MAKFREYDRVRVHMLSGPAESHLAFNESIRPPKVGDVGTVVGLRHANDGSEHFIVENVLPNGDTVWLAEFSMDELRYVEPGT